MTHALPPGGNVGLAQLGLPGPDGAIVVTLTWQTTPGVDADLSAFLCGADGRVRSDADFVFYNQPEGGGGAVRHLGRAVEGGRTVDRIAVTVGSLPTDVDKVVIGASLDPGAAGATFGRLAGLGVEVAAGPGAPAALRSEMAAGEQTALVFAEVYRRTGPAGVEWKVRSVGQGFTTGLAGLAGDVGVQVDDDGTEEAAAPVAAPTPPAAPAPPAAPPPPALSLEKKRIVDLEKRLASTGDTGMLSLVKKAGVSLEKRGLAEHTARVALVLDISGSMARLYKKGVVQRLAERVLALGLRFDDDGEVDVFLFGKRVHRPDGLSLDGYQSRVGEYVAQHKLEFDTKYGAAMAAVREHYFGSAQARTSPLAAETPVFVMFLTDGAPSDPKVATEQVRASSYEPVFWCFMGIGEARTFRFLQELDDLQGRHDDNADFFAVSADDLLGKRPIADEQLFEHLMNEYAAWVRRAPSRGLLRR